jgi:hypothetical protein
MSDTFKCPACGFGSMMVMDSRPSKVGEEPAVRRRRKCKNCDTRITTYEIAGAQDIEDLRFSLGRIIGLARNAQSALTILLDQYEPLRARLDR